MNKRQLDLAEARTGLRRAVRDFLQASVRADGYGQIMAENAADQALSVGLLNAVTNVIYKYAERGVEAVQDAERLIRGDRTGS